MRISATTVSVMVLMNTFVMIATDRAVIGQGLMPAPPEMKAVQFQVGDWSGKQKFYVAEGKVIESDATIHCSATMGGRYLEGIQKSTAPGFGVIEGLHLLTFDPESKKYKAWWFDSAAPGAMELEGTLDGNTLIMISKPIAIPGAGTPIFRATWQNKSDGELAFVLDIKSGEKWTPVITGQYSRKP